MAEVAHVAEGAAVEGVGSGGAGRDLPSQLWSHVLRFLSFREAVRATEVNHDFRRAGEVAIIMCPSLDLRWTRGRHQLGDAFQFITNKFAPRWTRLSSVALFGSSIDLDLIRKLQTALSPQLQFLSIESKTLNDDGLRVLAACTRLRSLLVPNCIRLTSDGLAALFACAPGLQEVDLSGCCRVDDRAVVALSRHCPGLVSVNLAQCFRLTNTSLQALSDNCGKLTHVNTNRCLKFSRGFVPFGAAMTRLQAVDFSSCLKLGDAGVAAVVTGSAATLTSLNLSGCSSLSGAAVSAVVAAVGHQLAYLSVAGVERISPEALLELNGVNCPRLAHLMLGKVPAVNDTVMVDALATLPLESFGINGCTGVTDVGMCAVACCGTLRRVNLENCFLLSDASLVALATHCPLLATLNVRICNALSLPGFETLAENCAGLKTVKLSGVHTQAETSAIVRALNAHSGCRVSL